MSIIHPLLQKLQNDVQELQKGLQPDHLSFWYQKIISDTKEMAPPWLQDKINVKQDPILPMKFNLDISKRAVRYFIIAVENNLPQMPYSTQLYFLKVQEILGFEMDKSFVEVPIIFAFFSIIDCMKSVNLVTCSLSFNTILCTDLSFIEITISVSKTSIISVMKVSFPSFTKIKLANFCASYLSSVTISTLFI